MKCKQIFVIMLASASLQGVYSDWKLAEVAGVGMVGFIGAGYFTHRSFLYHSELQNYLNSVENDIWSQASPRNIENYKFKRKSAAIVAGGFSVLSIWGLYKFAEYKQYV